MKRRNVWGITVGYILTSGWCLWVLIGFVGHVIPAIGIQNLNWPGSGHIFPAFDLVDAPVDLLIAAAATSLIALQSIALRFRSSIAALFAGVPMLLLGLPLFLLPLSRHDDSYLLEFIFVIVFHGSFLFGGVSMLSWGNHVSKRPEVRSNAN